MEILGYEIVRELGRGGMATVYLAVQQSLGRQVALKVMTPSLGKDGDFRERFFREGQIIARLEHPRIVTVHDFGSREGIHFLSMEYLSGGTLKERIDAGLEPKQAAEIIAPIAKALAYAHRNGVVHRDVKPHNILFRADGTAVLTDFGIARVLDADTHLTQTGFAIGSPRYMSPEQVLGRTVDARADIYSLGIVFYEMLTGDIPWADTEGSVALALKHCSAPIPILPPELRAFQGLLEKSLAKEPGERYQDAEHFASDLSALIAGDSYQTELPTILVAAPGTPPTTTMERPPAKPMERPEPEAAGQSTAKKPRARSVGAMIVLVIAAIAVGGYFAASHFLAKRNDAFLQSLSLPPATEDRPIAGNYESLAIQHLRKQQLNLGMELVQAGLRAVPNDSRLLALQAGIERHQAAQGHFETAKRHFERGMLEASSLEIEKGLEAVPDHPQLRQLQDQLQVQLHERRARKAAQLLEQAQLRFQAGDLDASLARISEGLWQVPDHQGLLSLRGEIAAQVERRRRVDGFLEQAHQLEQQELWQQALETVREGMSIDADDPRLKATGERLEAGLQRYRAEESDRILAEASRQRDLGDFAASLGLIDDGLWLVPEHPGLLGLRSEIQQTMEHRKKAQALLVKARQSVAEEDLDTSLQLIAEGLSLSGDDQALLELKQQVETGIRERAAREAKNLYTQAVALSDAGKLEESLSLAEKGLALTPGDQQLLALQDRLQQDIAQRAERIQQANALFTEAKERLQANAPQDAIGLAEQALELVPEHAGALALQQQANDAIALEKARVRAAGLLANTRQLLSDGRLEDARSLVAQGLTKIPGNADLLALKQQIDAEIEARDYRQAIAQQALDLLAEARAKREAGALEDALARIDDALELTPGNAELTSLRQELLSQLDLRRTVENYVAEAERLRAEGNLEQSLEKIKAALQLAADAPRAIALREQVTAEIEQKAKEQRELAEQQRKHEQAAALLSQAQQLLDQGELETGLSIARRGLELAPDHRQLAELETALREAINQRQANAARTADLLARAKARLDAGAPDEALGLVEDALQLSPENAEGLALRKTISGQLDLRRTVENYVAEAERLRAEGNLEQSLEKIKAALQLVADAPRAIALREQVTAEIEQKAKEQRELAEQQRKHEQAAALLSQAQQMRARGDLAGSLSTVQQALELTPDDTRLSDLQATLQTEIGRRQANAGANRLAEALQKKSEGDLAASLALVEQGLEVTPDNTALSDLAVDLRTEIARRQATEQQNNTAEQAKARVETLLAQCREHQRAKRLTTGKGGTALQCYNDVLKIEPGNEAAREGLQEIADQYAAWAVSALGGKNLSSARTYIERLATVDPEHGELGNLRQRLNKLSKAVAATPKPRRNTAPTSRRVKPTAPARRKTQPSTRTQDPVVTRKAPAYTPPPPPKAAPPPPTPAPKKKRYGVTF